MEWTLFSFTSINQLFGIRSFISILEGILNFVCIFEVVERRLKFVLPFYWFSKGLEVHLAGDKDRVMEKMNGQWMNCGPCDILGGWDGA